MKVMHVVGARPNFMKTAPLMREMARYPQHFDQVLIHTGQHYDHNMSRIFFEELDLPEPDEFLNVGAGTHAEQTARVMLAFEPVLVNRKPDLVVVVGDVNSTLACALVCTKLGVKVAHVEAGLRSGDRTMPEEINRILTDQMADLLFTPSRDADANLLREGIAASKIHFVGNIMIDTLIRMLPKTQNRSVLNDFNLTAGGYLLVTLHRPCNVDHLDTLQEILTALITASAEWMVVFPVHPRTRSRIEQLGLPDLDTRVRLLDPLGHLDFLALMQSAKLVVTDSGGVQEETTYLGIPCLTVRPNTERPVTITDGTNRLVEANRESILRAICQAVDEPSTSPRRPELWDGRAAGRIVDILLPQAAKAGRTSAAT